MAVAEAVAMAEGVTVVKCIVVTKALAVAAGLGFSSIKRFLIQPIKYVASKIQTYWRKHQKRALQVTNSNKVF